MQSFMSILANPGAWARRILYLLAGIGILVLVLMWLTSGAKLPDDGDPVAVTTDDAIAFFSRSTTALQSAGSDRTIRMTVTQEELTSFVSVGSRLTRVMQRNPGQDQIAELERMIETGDLQGTELLERWEGLLEERDQTGWRRLVPEDFKLELTLEEPEVRFLADGSVIVRGSGEWGFFSVPARIVAVPRVAEGRLEFDFVEGQLGRVGLSETLFGPVADGLERLLLAGNDVAEVTSLQVGDGTMTFAARLGSAAGG